MSEADFQLASDSPCLPQNNACAALMGAFPEGCAHPAAAPGEAPANAIGRPRLAIFPNPVRGELHLSLSGDERTEPCDGSLPLRIIDPSGRCVYDGSIAARELLAGSARLDLRWELPLLAAGVYFGRLEDCAGRTYPFRFTLVK